MTVHANCRIRRIYFADALYEEDEIPADFRMYVDKKGARGGAPQSLDNTAQDIPPEAPADQ